MPAPRLPPTVALLVADAHARGWTVTRTATGGVLLSGLSRAEAEDLYDEHAGSRVVRVDYSREVGGRGGDRWQAGVRFEDGGK